MQVQNIFASRFLLTFETSWCPWRSPRSSAIKAALEMCQKALNDFMAKKRAFPRFYFMSSNDHMHVLSNRNQPAKPWRAESSSLARARDSSAPQLAFNLLISFRLL